MDNTIQNDHATRTLFTYSLSLIRRFIFTAVKRIKCCSQSITMPTVTTATSTSSSSTSSTGYWSPMSDVSAGGLSSDGQTPCQAQAIAASSPSDFFAASPCSQSSMAEAMISSLSGPPSLSSNYSSSSSSVLSLSPRLCRSSSHRVNRCRSAIELSATGSGRLVDGEHESTTGGLLDEVDVECSAATLVAAAKRRRHDVIELQDTVHVISDSATDENKTNSRSQY